MVIGVGGPRRVERSKDFGRDWVYHQGQVAITSSALFDCAAVFNPEFPVSAA